jgi:nucleotide-binding universal stress UspA family protein
MFQRILIPYDGSERSRQAIPIAARLARAHNGVVLLLQVTPPLIEDVWQMDTPLLMPQESWQAEQADITAELKAIASCEELQGIPIETTIVGREGSTAKTILEIARSWHADLIILCSHGRTGFTRWVLGSIVDTIVRQSPIPTLILRVKGKSFPTQGNRSVRVFVGLDGSTLAETALMPEEDRIRRWLLARPDTRPGGSGAVPKPFLPALHL